ncbi:hypothetical protein PIB30_072783 [Stylosanthes scabra]|uniref:Transmembrane protein n=1 Tax=Stylosanthes scabra TaxID=79078 RepID=A0ABU6SPQ4_9FABA|nr:hypothetical protein [Stylosanthes scabra]
MGGVNPTSVKVTTEGSEIIFRSIFPSFIVVTCIWDFSVSFVVYGRRQPHKCKGTEEDQETLSVAEERACE